MLSYGMKAVSPAYTQCTWYIELISTATRWQAIQSTEYSEADRALQLRVAAAHA